MGKSTLVHLSAVGRVTSRKLPARPEGPIAERRRYTWRPGPKISAALPNGFGLAMNVLVGADGSLRFAAADGMEGFLLKASLGGHAILDATRGPDRGRSFSYHAMRLIYQHAPRTRESFSRRFLSEDDLRIAGRAWAGSGRDVLPGGLGADAQGGGRWSVAEVMKRGREAALADGEAGPTTERIIAAGLLEAARLDPIHPATVSEDEARRLVRLALFDLGPDAKVDDKSKEAVTRRLLAALESHIDDDSASFRRWFFERRDDLIYRIAKQTRDGGPIDRALVRAALLEIVFDAFRYVGDCVGLQMQAFRLALPEPLSDGDRALFGLLYERQAWLGGLPLVLLHRRFEFLRGAILTILDAPGDLNRVGALLRLLQYHGEMASARREADHIRKACPPGGGVEYPADDLGERVADRLGLRTMRNDTPFEGIVDRLLESRPIACPCGPDATWERRVDESGFSVAVVAIGLRCGSGHERRIEVPIDEFRRVGLEMMPGADA